jgi:protoporphyrinogen oxidase
MHQHNSQERWAVVGGGFLGMTLALRLAQQGQDVTLYEAATSLGGVASAWQLGDIVWDRHYHVTLFSDTHLRSLLRELGLEAEMRWKTTRTGFFSNSQLYSMSNTLEFLRFPLLGPIEKLRLALTILRASIIKDGRWLEKIPVKDWLTNWSGQGVTDKIWLPLLRAKLGENYHKTSAAFIWASIARMYAARRTGAKTELFGYLPGGYARIVERFQKLLDAHQVKCQFAQAVHAIVSTSAGSLRIDFGNTNSQTFDQVILTTAAPVAARLCPELRASEKNQLTAIQYQGVICASVLLKNSLADFYITNITDHVAPFTAVIEMSALVDRSQFRGRALVYLPKYVSSDSTDFDRSDNQIREDFVSALERMYPRFSRDQVLCFQVSRVKYLLPIPTINYSANLPQMATSVKGLHLVSSAHIVNGTLNVNETVRLAASVAEKLGKTAPVANPVPAYFDYEFAENNR